MVFLWWRILEYKNIIVLPGGLSPRPETLTVWMLDLKENSWVFEFKLFKNIYMYVCMYRYIFTAKGRRYWIMNGKKLKVKPVWCSEVTIDIILKTVTSCCHSSIWSYKNCEGDFSLGTSLRTVGLPIPPSPLNTFQISL